jgi:hypothetical protein
VRVTLLLSVLIALSSACGATMRTPEAVLEEQLQAFHGHMLWGRFDDASTFVAEEERARFLGMHDELGDEYDVTEFEVQSVDVAPGGESATVEVWMQSYRLPSTRIDEGTWRETWLYNKDARTWQLTSRERIE